MNRKKVKLISGLCAFLLAANAFCMPVNLISPVKAELTQAELEQQKLDNEKKIAELQKEIEEAKKKYAQVQADENEKLDYQDILNEKIELQNENISVVVKQMSQIDDEIQETLSDISDLEVQIKNQNRMVDANMELYKQRLRASYMAENDTISAVLGGSVSFVDILSKLEIVSKVAQHDSNLINELENQLRRLKTLSADLGIKQEELTENLADAAERKGELDERLSVLQDDYNSTQEELDRILDRKYTISENIEENEEIIALKEAEQKKIDDEIEAILEQLRLESIRVSESVSQSVAESVSESEAEASRRAEEERKKAEEEKKRAEAAANQSRPVTQAPEASEPEPETPAPAEPEPEPDNSSLMFWPVPGYKHLSSDFWDGRNHGAIDIDGVGGPGGAIGGAKVYAADSGIVAGTSTGCTHYNNPYDRCGGGYGNYVTLAHSDGVYSTVYAHLQAVYVSPGQSVKKGDLIGLVGSTGSSTGSHLHFEVRKNGVKTDPASYSYQ